MNRALLPLGFAGNGTAKSLEHGARATVAEEWVLLLLIKRKFASSVQKTVCTKTSSSVWKAREEDDIERT